MFFICVKSFNDTVCDSFWLGLSRLLCGLTVALNMVFS